MNFDGQFQLPTNDAKFTPAILEGNVLVPNENAPNATMYDIKVVYENRITPLLTDEEGKVYTFEEAGLDYATYYDKNRKNGFAHLKYKLFYRISENESPSKVYGYTFPVNGFGLWDAMYALMSIESDCNTILGFSVYEQKETPGLGAGIGEEWWQQQFYKKKIFRESSDGKVDYATSPLGINVVKPGKMDTLTPQQRKSSVDGITGASITSDAIMEAIRNSLQPYRNLLINLRKEYGKKK